MPSEKKIVLLLPFLFQWIFLFLFHLNAVARTSGMTLNRSGKRELPCLVLDLGKKAFSLSPLNTMLSVSFSHMPRIVLKVPFYSSFVECFLLWKCVEFFSALFEMIKFPLFCINLVFYNDRNFHIWSHPHITGINLTWSWYTILSVCCYTWFASIFFFEDFLHLCKGFWSVVFLWCVWLWNQTNAGLTEWVRECPPPL